MAPILILFLCLISSWGHAGYHLSHGLDYPAICKKQVDLVIFSYDRPMQLYAFMESCEKHITNLNKIHLIYRSSDKHFDRGYKIVFKRFPYVRPHKQGKKAPADFKPLTIKSVLDKKSRSPYIMFAVDDIIVTDDVDLIDCTKAMEKYKSWCFSLRLGLNITHSSLDHSHTGNPFGKLKRETFFSWKFDDLEARDGWAYPNSVDVTIYRKKDIERFLKKADYLNPNLLEASWHDNWRPKRKRGLCYQHSKAFNLPLNVVNPYWNSKHLNLSVKGLLDKFLSGYKIDVDGLHHFNNDSPHMMIEPKFILSGAI